MKFKTPDVSFKEMGGKRFVTVRLGTDQMFEGASVSFPDPAVPSEDNDTERKRALARAKEIFELAATRL